MLSRSLASLLQRRLMANPAARTAAGSIGCGNLQLNPLLATPIALSNTSSLLLTNSCIIPLSIRVRCYVSRAHPQTIPEYAVPTALQKILEGIEQRKVQRTERWERNKEKRQSKGIQVSGPYRNQDESIELAINLNVDPRRPGQALRGSVVLPHGTGKTVSCLVFTSDPAVIQQAQQSGHKAGGEELIDRILNGEESLDDYQRALATKKIVPLLQKQLARLLGPRKLMPNPKTNTIFDDGNILLQSLKEQASTITYRTESSGILHFLIGKGSFQTDHLLDNFQTICKTVQDIKPESYGKGKNKKSSGSGSGNKKKIGKNVKYWLRAHLSATQGKSVRMDLRSVDPTSPFFMKEPE